MRNKLTIFLCLLTGLLTAQSQGVRIPGNTNTNPNSLKWAPTDNSPDEIYILRGNWSTGELGYWKLNLRDSISALVSNFNPIAGTGIGLSGSYPNITITNTAPDQTVTLNNGTGISITGTYPTFTVTNTSPNVGNGTVTDITVSSSNGFAGIVTNPTTSPSIAISTSVTGLLKGNGTSVSAATAGTDYLSPTGSGTGLTGIPYALTGTANQINLSAATGNITFSLPSDVTIDGSLRTAGINLVRVAQGPAMSINNGTESNYIEFTRTGFNEKGSIGALGNFEMNMSYNMDYKDGVHRYYDATKNANWLALNGSGLYLQYSPSGQPVPGDMWTSSGSLVNLFVDNNGFLTMRGGGYFPGNVGIGTGMSSPTDRLSINGAGTNGGISAYYHKTAYGIRGVFAHTGDAAGILSGGGLQIAAQGTNNADQGAGDINFYTTAVNSAGANIDATYVHRMKIRYDGNIGIGNIDPGSNLDIRNGTTAQTAEVYSTYTNSTNYVKTVIGRSAYWGGNQGISVEGLGTGANPTFIIGTNGTGNILLATAGTTRFYISGTGHMIPGTINGNDIGSSGTPVRSVYIGTSLTSPLATISTSTTTPIVYGGSGTTSTLTLRSSSGSATTGSDIIFGDNDTEWARITNNGNVGIGVTPNSATKVSVAGPVDTGAKIGLGDVTTQSVFTMRAYGDSGGANHYGLFSVNTTEGNEYDATKQGGGVYFDDRSGVLPVRFMYKTAGAGTFGALGISASGNVVIGTNVTIAQAVSKLAVPIAPTATANYALLSLGNSPFDGSTAGFYTGSANGTVIGANISGSANFIDMQKAGVSHFKVSNLGLTLNNATDNPSITFQSSADPRFSITNANAILGILGLGTAGYAMSFNMPITMDTRNNGAYYDFRNNFSPTSGTVANASMRIAPTINQTGGANGITRGLYINPTITAAADFRAFEVSTGRSVFGDVVKLKAYTVAALPAGQTGDQAYVTDATAPTYLGALVGGGAVVCPVIYNGSAWVSH